VRAMVWESLTSNIHPNNQPNNLTTYHPDNPTIPPSHYHTIYPSLTTLSITIIHYLLLSIYYSYSYLPIYPSLSLLLSRYTHTITHYPHHITLSRYPAPGTFKSHRPLYTSPSCICTLYRPQAHASTHFHSHSFRPSHHQFRASPSSLRILSPFSTSNIDAKPLLQSTTPKLQPTQTGAPATRPPRTNIQPRRAIQYATAQPTTAGNTSTRIRTFHRGIQVSSISRSHDQQHQPEHADRQHKRHKT
jgi:hypothetical protein